MHTVFKGIDFSLLFTRNQTVTFNLCLNVVYKAQFPKTLAELREGEPYMKKMVGGLSALLAASVVFFVFLRKYGK